MMKVFGEDIWLAEGTTAEVAGFRYPTRMAVIRLADGRLFIWSPVRLSQELRAAVDRLGTVSYLVAPSRSHHLFLADWRAAYSGAALYAAPGLREWRPDLAIDGELGDAPIPEWSDDLDQVVVANFIATEVVFFHRKSRTALFTDLIQHFDRGWFSGWRAAVAWLDLMSAPEPQVPRKFRAALVDRRSARAAIRRVLAWPTAQVVMAHGQPVTEDGREFIERTFRWLLS